MRVARMSFGAALLAAALALTACGRAGEGEGQGVVTSVDASRAQVTIQHGDIPGLMKAMTMTFAVRDPALLEGVEVGDEVRFRAEYAGGTYSITAIEYD